MEPFVYKTIINPVEGSLFKERKSKFIGYAYPITGESQILERLDFLKTEHPKANHVCYAWRLGTDPVSWRANDDGEPNNSAGMPIYGQIQAFDLTDVLVAVVRYFGGTKLGVGGLITAYKNTAQLTLENADLRTIVPLRNLEISFGYPLMHRAMRIIKKQNIQISDQVNGQILKYRLMVPVSNYQKVVKQFRALKGIEVYEEDARG